MLDPQTTEGVGGCTSIERSRAHFAAIEAAGVPAADGLTWSGPVESCDVCLRSMAWDLYMIDGPAEASSDPKWGSLCVVCALEYAPDVGWGRAQLYKRRGPRWFLVTGGPPVDGGSAG